MEATAKYKYNLENLNCAGCASKIESDLIGADFVEVAMLNFASKQVIVKPKIFMDEETVRTRVDEIVKRYEKDVHVKSIIKGQSHEGHHHEHEHGHNHNHGGHGKGLFSEKAQRYGTWIGAVLFGIGLFLNYQSNFDPTVTLVLFVLAYLLIGGEVLKSAFENIKRGSWFDEQFLMTIATFSAWGIGEYPEAVAVMLFYRVGEFFEDYAVGRSRKTIEGLLNIKENTTHTVDGLYQVQDKDTDMVKIGTKILVKPGERVPLDGVVVEGSSSLDVSALTGEAIPINVSKGDKILSGSINQNSVLYLETTADFENSMVGKILDLIENAGGKKAKTEKFITRFARYYTPAVVFTALGLAIIPPLFTGFNFGEWVYRASIFLVVSCPCALVISVPLGYYGGIGKASKHGILIKGGNYLEALTKVDVIYLDKTGTLTEGKFELEKVLPAKGISEDQLLQMAATIEANSNHPIARSIVSASEKRGLLPEIVEAYEEVAGKGVKGLYAGKTILAGRAKLLEEVGIVLPEIEHTGSVVYLATDHTYMGALVVADLIKASSKQALSDLKKSGIKEVVMLTGDKDSIGQAVGRAVGVDKALTELLPDEKVKAIEMGKREGHQVVFVGDGLNDAPALALADVGIAMGGAGADLSIEAADVVIMNDDLAKLPQAVKIAKGTQRIIIQNIVFALGVKLLVLGMGALGFATMWEAVFADVGVALIAIMNSMRNNA